MNRRFALLLVCALWSGLSASAQNRVRYEDLARTHRDPAWHQRTVSLTEGADSIRALTSFRIANSAIAFRRVPGTDSLQADIGVTFDYLDVADRPNRRREAAEPPVSLGRVVWTQRVTVHPDHAQDPFRSISAMVEIRLPKGRIRVLPRVEVDGIERTTPISDIVHPQAAALIPIGTDGEPLHLGSNTRFGEPAAFQVLTTPGVEAATYRLFRMESGDRDSVLIAEGSIEGGILNPAHPHLDNRTHRVSVYDPAGTRLGGMTFLPRWYGMPVGLLNLDIAIDLMRFSIGRDELRAMRRGGAEEREARFRAWWAERDPTPETPFNELMAEYYGRIHHAYEAFSTPTVTGFDSDMGATWIRYGKPLSVERRLPAGSPALEVWDYGNRRFIFRATTGFGDFELVSTP